MVAIHYSLLKKRSQKFSYLVTQTIALLFETVFYPFSIDENYKIIKRSSFSLSTDVPYQKLIRL